jgi:cytochrome c biogenesis protein
MLNYAPQVQNFGEGVQVALFRPNQQPAVYWVVRGLSNPGQQGENGFDLRLEGIASHEYTGLQVTKDPGVWIVWLGCGLMILGFILSFFFSHQRIWLKIPKGAGGEIVLAGSTNKNRVGFERSFQQVAEGIRSMGKG